MKAKRLLSLILAVIMLALTTPSAAFAEGSIAFAMTCSLPTDEKVKLGDTVTYTVKITEGLSDPVVGTLFFMPSDNLTYVSATLLGEEAAATKSEAGDNAGAYGILLLGNTSAEASESFCTITFRVTGAGGVSVNFYTYGLTKDKTSYITPVIENGTISHDAEALTAPTVTTDALPEAVMGYEYSAKLEGTDNDFLTWQAIEALPDGLTLSSDGVLSGVPEVFGDFTITVKATLLNELASESTSIPLTILEKPRKLELENASAYSIDENNYLTAVVEKTNLPALLSNFKNSERIKVFNAAGNEITSSTAYIGTGCTVSLMHGDEKVHSVTVIVKGDVSGNGQVDPIDYQRIRRYLFGNYPLEGAYLEAAKVSGKSTVTPIDYQRVRRHIFGNYNIYE